MQYMYIDNVVSVICYIWQTFVSPGTPVAVRQTLVSRRVKNKMFTFIKSIVVSRISPIFTGKNKIFWEFPKREEIFKKRVDG